MGKKKSNTGGSNTRSRRTTKAERKAIGEENAPSVVHEPIHMCLVCQKETMLTEPYGHMRLCEMCLAETKLREMYLEVWPAMHPEMLCDLWEWLEPNRDMLCEMMHPDFRRSLIFQYLMQYFEEWMQLELWHAQKSSDAVLWYKKERGWEGIAKHYLNSLGIDAKHITVDWLGSDLHTFDRYRYSMVLATTPNEKKEWKAPEISEAYRNELDLISKVRSNEEVIEEIAQKKVEGKGLARLDELTEAIIHAIENWNKNEEARALFDGYRLHQAPGIPTGCHPPMLPRPNQRWKWVILSQKDFPSPLVVGFQDESSEEPRFVVKRSDIREFMLKVNAGPRLHHPSLGPGIEYGKPRSVDKAKSKKRLKMPSGASRALYEVSV